MINPFDMAVLDRIDNLPVGEKMVYFTGCTHQHAHSPVGKALRERVYNEELGVTQKRVGADPNGYSIFDYIVFKMKG